MQPAKTASSAYKIRRIAMVDFPAWLPLWDGNNKGVRDEAITAETWSRLIDPDIEIHAMIAEDQHSQAVGLIQYVIHPVIGAINPVCYMQDLYVDPLHRKKGIARLMVKTLAVQAKTEKWARMYWLAEGDNKAAQKLYENLGVKLNFTLHVLLP